MDVFEAINTRRSVRKFLSKPLDFEQLTGLIELACQAPNAGNLQNWRFIVVTDKSLIEQLPNFCLGQDCACAPAIVIVCTDDEIMERNHGIRGSRLYSIQNTAAACQNFLLGAHAMGLGAVWIGAFDEDRIKDVYKLPDKVRAHAIIALGYPDEEPAPKSLKPITDITFFNEYGMPFRDLHMVLRNYSTEIEKKTETAKSAIEQGKEKLKEHIDRVMKK